LTQKGQTYTFNYLVSAAFKMEGALSFTSQRAGERRVVCEMIFEKEIPGICISGDLESEVLLGKGLTVRYEGEELLFIDGHEYTVKRFTYDRIIETDNSYRFEQTLDGMSDDLLRSFYREEGNSQTPSQRGQYFGPQLESDLQDCITKAKKDRGVHPGLKRQNALPSASMPQAELHEAELPQAELHEAKGPKRSRKRGNSRKRGKSSPRGNSSPREKSRKRGKSIPPKHSRKSNYNFTTIP